jgi:hypothetical protein
MPSPRNRYRLFRRAIGPDCGCQHQWRTAISRDEYEISFAGTDARAQLGVPGAVRYRLIHARAYLGVKLIELKGNKRSR